MDYRLTIIEITLEEFIMQMAALAPLPPLGQIATANGSIPATAKAPQTKQVNMLIEPIASMSPT